MAPKRPSKKEEPMLAELRETTIRRLGELLDAAPDVADQIAALERAGVAPEKLFAAALKRRGAVPAARPPALDGSWAAALRTGRVAASLHSLVVDNGALGLGGDDDAFEPASTSGAVVVAAAAGGSHSVVLLEGGDVLGFGSNADGQLGELEDVEDVESDGDGEDDGDGDGADGASSGDDASDASDDSDGSDETAAEAGAVFALGAGQHGQLGAGLPRAAAPVPVAIPAAAAPPRARRGQAWAAKRKTKSKQQGAFSSLGRTPRATYPADGAELMGVPNAETGEDEDDAHADMLADACVRPRTTSPASTMTAIATPR
ncbi:ubiquitin-protein transferase [Aureococcus anophagefferens]|nr:ubiquitin-protein transferase [Aureococcus anophagefferens]